MEVSGVTHAHGFADQAELLLDGLPGSNLPRCGIGAEEVPGVEPGEVLQRAEELVAAGGRSDKLEVVSHRGVVHESVGNHDERVGSVSKSENTLCRRVERLAVVWVLL